MKEKIFRLPIQLFIIIYLKIERSVKDGEFLDIEINTDGCFVIVGEDIVSKPVD